MIARALQSQLSWVLIQRVFLPTTLQAQTRTYAHGVHRNGLPGRRELVRAQRVLIVVHQSLPPKLRAHRPAQAVPEQVELPAEVRRVALEGSDGLVHPVQGVKPRERDVAAGRCSSKKGSQRKENSGRAFYRGRCSLLLRCFGV